MNGELTGKMTFEAITASVAAIIQSVNGRLEERGCPEDIRRKIDVALDEIVSNIIDYAYPEGGGQILVDYCVSASEAIIVIKDSGIPFDPVKNVAPDLSKAGENGGFGIFLTMTLMDSVTYERKEGLNVLTIVKAWA